MKRIIAATAVAAMLTVTGVASAKTPPGAGNGYKGTDHPCKDKICQTR